MVADGVASGMETFTQALANGHLQLKHSVLRLLMCSHQLHRFLTLEQSGHAPEAMAGMDAPMMQAMPPEAMAGMDLQ